MNKALIVIILAQVLFSTSDVMARYYMKKLGFHLASFISVWFLLYALIRTVATFGQLYALVVFELGRSQTLFAVASIITANILGLLLFKEVLNPLSYAGIVLAILALALLGFSKV